MKPARRKGFTLIELLVVVSIIAILSAIGLSTFANTRNKALDSQYRAEVKQAQNAMENNVSDTTGYYVALSGSMFESGSIPTSITITYSGPGGGQYDKYCIESPALKASTTSGNCTGRASSGVCAFASGSTKFCAQNLR